MKDKTSKNEEQVKEPTIEAQGEKTPQKSEEQSDEFKAALAQKEHWRTKFEKLAEQVQNATKEEPEVKEPPKENSDDEWRQQVEFSLKHRELGSEEFDIVKTIARGKGVSLDDALAAQEAKTLIEAHKQKVASEQQTPTSTPHGSPVIGEDVKITPGQDTSTNAENYRKIMEKAFGQQQQKF